MILERLIVRLEADPSNLTTGVSKAQTSLQRLGDQATRTGRALTLGLSVPVALAGGAAVSAAVKMDSLARGLEVSAGSAEAAAKQMEELERIARLPGLGFQEVIQGAVALNTTLQELPNSLQYSNRLLMQFGNAIALTGGGKQELDRVITQLGQIAAAGKVLTQDLRPIIQTAPSVANALRNAFGTISPEEINKLGLSSQEFFDRLIEGLEDLPRASAGARNSFENFTDALFKARVAIGERLLPVITPLIERVTELLESMESLTPATVARWVGFGAALMALGPTVIIVGKLTAGIIALTAAGNAAAFFQLAAGVRSLSAAFTLLSMAIPGAVLIKGAIVALSLALSGLFGWWAKNKVEAAGLREEMDKATESARRFSQAISDMTESQVTAEIAAIEAQLKNLRAVQDQVKTSPGLGFVVGSGFGAEAVQADIERLEARLEALRAPIKVKAKVEIDPAFEALLKKYKHLIAAPAHKWLLATGATDHRLKEVDVREKPLIRRDPITQKITETGGLLDLGTAASVSSIFPEEEVSRLELTLMKLRVAADEAWAGLKNLSKRFLSGIGDFFSQIASLFNPLQIIATVFNQALREAVGAMQPLIDAVQPLVAVVAQALAPAFEALAPVIVKLSPSIAALAEMLSGIIIAVAPLLEALVPVLELVVRGFSYLVSGIGYVIRFIGDIINAIPDWAIPKWLEEAGAALEGFGQGLIDAGAATREALDRGTEGLDGFSGALGDVTASLTNVPQIFDLALRRRQAALAGLTSTEPPQQPPQPPVGPPGGPDGPTHQEGAALQVHLHNPPAGMDVEGTKRQLLKALKNDPEVRYALRAAFGTG